MNTGLSGYCNEGIPVPRVLCHSFTEVTEVPGKGIGTLQNLQQLRVRVRKSYTTSASFPGMVAQACRIHRISERIQNMLYPNPGYYCGHGRT